MKEAIEKYKKAQAKLDAAEKALNAVVSPILAKAETESEIMDLIEQMPPNYPATRRMYEKILRSRN